MAIQTQFGKAFEYACLCSFGNFLSTNQQVLVETNSAYTVARDSYNATDYRNQNKMARAADAAVRVITRLEPYLQHPNGNEPLVLSIQTDSAGMVGDVRDLIAIRQRNDWEIGISCKHNHNAIKHSRLSMTIDFGQKWFGIPCSPSYFKEISPVFSRLEDLRYGGATWSNIQDKIEDIYIPILLAFIHELRRLDIANPGEIPKRFVSYLLGVNDFYKVIALDNLHATQIQAINLYGTLNQQSGIHRSLVRVRQLSLPTQFHNIDFIRNTTVEVTCDHGWTISLRLHNASTRVEPSLKFDVNLTGIPPTLYSQTEPW